MLLLLLLRRELCMVDYIVARLRVLLLRLLWLLLR